MTSLLPPPEIAAYYTGLHGNPINPNLCSWAECADDSADGHANPAAADMRWEPQLDPPRWWPICAPCAKEAIERYPPVDPNTPVRPHKIHAAFIRWRSITITGL